MHPNSPEVLQILNQSLKLLYKVNNNYEKILKRNLASPMVFQNIKCPQTLSVVIF